jgi:hypothetical protein
MGTGSRNKLLDLSYGPADLCTRPAPADGSRSVRYARAHLFKQQPLLGFAPFDFNNTPKSCFKSQTE